MGKNTSKDTLSSGLCCCVYFLTSDSVGFCPRALKASPIWATCIFPSPLLSNSWNASWNSETIYSILRSSVPNKKSQQGLKTRTRSRTRTKDQGREPRTKTKNQHQRPGLKTKDEDQDKDKDKGSRSQILTFMKYIIQHACRKRNVTHHFSSSQCQRQLTFTKLVGRGSTSKSPFAKQVLNSFFMIEIVEFLITKIVQ